MYLAHVTIEVMGVPNVMWSLSIVIKMPGSGDYYMIRRKIQLSNSSITSHEHVMTNSTAKNGNRFILLSCHRNFLLVKFLSWNLIVILPIFGPHQLFTWSWKILQLVGTQRTDYWCLKKSQGKKTIEQLVSLICNQNLNRKTQAISLLHVTCSLQ